VLDEVYTAWADNDADAFVAPYAETATAVLPGTYLTDRQAIRATMATLSASELNGSKASTRCGASGSSAPTPNRPLRPEQTLRVPHH
jgi:uncharacterized protein (TIGR02246 family)